MLKLLAAMILLPMTAGAAPLPQLRIEPTTGGSIFYVKNITSQPLTGYLIELVDYPGSQYSLWQDDVMEPIAPGQEKRIQVGNMTVGAVPDYVKIQAAIYADGATAGVPEKITQFIERRRFILQTVRQTIERLEKAGPKEALIADLKHAAEIPAGKSTLAAQFTVYRQAESRVFSETAAYLADHSAGETIAWLRAWEKALAESKPA